MCKIKINNLKIKYEKNNLNITKLDIDVFDLNIMAKK